MNQTTTGSREHEWHDYYDRFGYFSADRVRDGCQPRMMQHDGEAPGAIVLVHGLTDSPHFVTAIGEYFFNQLGYNVYIPLLHCHGLKDPDGMEAVELEEWKANVNFAVKTAAAKSGIVSIGGLSTGGTLGLYTTVTNPAINGDLYLFSAALDLAGGRTGLIGELKERLLRSFLVDVLDRDKPLIGKNPYRYSRMDLDGARELSRLIKETDLILDGFSQMRPFPARVFAAHSESDTTANITGIEDLQKRSDPSRFTFLRLDRTQGVSHASLVLKESIVCGDEVLEEKNPAFDDMMSTISAFV